MEKPVKLSWTDDAHPVEFFDCRCQAVKRAKELHPGAVVDEPEYDDGAVLVGVYATQEDMDSKDDEDSKDDKTLAFIMESVPQCC